MSYVGIDLSLTRTAIAIIDSYGGVTIRQKATTGRADASIRDRLHRLNDIANWVCDVVVGEPTDLSAWAIEGPSIGSKNAASAHDRSGLWWMVTDAITASGMGYPIVVPPTVRAKYATGKGNAGKDEVLAAVIRRWNFAPVENNDQADAFVIAAIAAHLNDEPLSEMPTAHLDALKTLKERP